VPPASSARTGIYATLALLAFASNSLLCRLALGGGSIDPASFTSIRLLSGAAMLVALAAFPRHPHRAHRNWISSAALAVYALTFSFAYVTLDVGTGALLLFGMVQTTMIGAALWQGDRVTSREWLGLACALGGLVYLVSPGLTAPPLVGSALMMTSGTAWGLYTLRGRSMRDAIATNAGNFVRAVPLALAVTAVAVAQANVTVSATGVLLGVVSGALASALGYIVWYAALPGLSAIRAATVQLSVPVIASAGGILLLDERLTLRLVVAAILILGGVGLAVSKRTSTPR
jgi:drug/metabolite transporter (DMT)-like permease